ncbi:MAG TPA: hypothetical protein ENO21_04885, partial [Firmicutes bacterium]|nr:hypothetical protein [Bacillota bacterium]
MGATRFAPTLLLCAAIAACTAPAGSSPEARPSPSAPEQSAPPELAAQLPPLPLDRDASAILHTELEGRDTFDRSANAGNFADTLSLTAAADALEWGIWRFPLGAADQVDLQSVVISCSVLVGEEMYVALANYGMGRWEIKPALAFGEEGASYPLNNADYRSPADCFYIAAMAYNGVIALVSDIELTVDSDAIYTLVDDSAVSGSSAPLALVSGHPAVAYVGAGCLKYCRAADAAGSLWGELVTLHEPESPLKRVGTSANLLVVDGNPAVGYCDEEHTDLYFVRAEDALGSGWGEPQLIDDAGDVGRCTSLAVVGGRPAMAYSDHTNQQLKYVRALDATGSGWDSPAIVDDGTAGAAGEFCSLAVVSNQPAIAYTFQPSIIRMRYVR